MKRRLVLRKIYVKIVKMQADDIADSNKGWYNEIGKIAPSVHARGKISLCIYGQTTRTEFWNRLERREY